VLLEETLQKLEDQQQQKKVLMCDAAKAWNKAPEKIRTSKTWTTAKKAIQEHLQVTGR
jgi:hypothetical protein